MQHYLAELKLVGDLVTEYPHTPDDQQASIQEYLGAKFDAGWELVSIISSDGNWRFIFRPNAV